MPLYRLSWRYLQRPTLSQVLLAGGVGFLTLFLLLGSWTLLTRVAKRHIDQSIAHLSQKLGVPVTIGKTRLTPAGAHFEDIRIGTAATVVIDRMVATVALNPFSANFGGIDTIAIEQVRVKSGLTALKSTTKSWAHATLAADDSRGSFPAKSIDKLFAALPTSSLYLRSAAVSIVDDDGMPHLTVRGLSLLIDKPESRVLFRIASARYQNASPEEMLQGRFELAPKTDEYRFFLRRKAGPGNTANAANAGDTQPSRPNSNLWAISGHLHRDLSAARITTAIHRLPVLLGDALAPYLGKAATLNLRSRLDLARSAEGWTVILHVQSLGSVAMIPLLSSHPVGPARFDLSLEGVYQDSRRTLTVTNASLSLPDRKTGHYGNTPVQLTLAGILRLPAPGTDAELLGIKTADSGIAWHGQLTLAQTSCQQLLDAAPVGFLPSLTEFKLAGTVSAGVSVQYDESAPDTAKIDLSEAMWGCRVTHAPFTYSAEHLAGPFTLHRELGNGEEAVDINVSPLSAKYTPLEAIAKNLSQAVVTSEDATFFTHKGIDTAALANALKRDLSEKRVVVGGSTITMQTVKNLFLTPERTLTRKVQELFLAWHLENILPKERILEIYMNIVELGPGIYGVTTASDRFFGKQAFDLDLLESAYIASLLPSPKARYRYFCAGQISPNFQGIVNTLLRRMLALGRVSNERYLQALSASLNFNSEARAAAEDCVAIKGAASESDTPATGAEGLPRQVLDDKP